MNIVVIIPTYNEKESIAKTIDDLETVFSTIKNHQLKILVVDDSSPDGTADIVAHLAKKSKLIKLVKNPQKLGLGGAYIKGFKYAMENIGADAVFEYDADGSHQPQYLPGMIKVLESKADVVVGSRYIPGGKMPDNWGLHRKLISYFGNLIARLVLFTPQFKDMTSGYRGTKVSFLKKIDLDNLISKQFAYKIQLYYELARYGAKVVEFPIEFVDRSRGKSKFPRNNIVDSLRVVFSLRLRDSAKLIKVMIVGGLGTIVQLVFFNLLRLKLSLVLAQNLSIEAAVVSNFVLNNIWTFKEKKFAFSRLGELAVGFVKFNVLSLGSIVIQNIALLAGVKVFGRSFLIENSLVLVGILLGLIWNYLMYTRVVWKTHG
ncbi:MAG: Glycosyltransferase [Candidatus Beckwithbacteria bacterium GW2011_GWB1_47_15]|uniref:Glycosyltransferase n=1 Tax=Candidatus Beckwithbacteria bacterium GW2011_GWB1_47_15 TaxID=1618371 RepID=A0A0G1RV25_9BACT|nr:MAG: Glycosyltransferases involved in cell wall biogenesis [Candidatus Beckwithbacteria bacterium GW2011_GWC1_49_16]KKU35753.1 MAG: Glycosyltransferase [Candidatus Beckwithbacteria bacterium GW2011_GWA1_46_30]KKU61007.1 MAG: Glycosyltransferase [Candidatus Beckwithbacteria bacterium GW2011_GWB1_47_15]KKU72312.1 MAG: Glycosyltransferase [Candidatus Beckwithbacteria bacterium GW2011_GWA2_47_25]KKW04928.1 MAG: Glycosyltransferase [Candidatus Beckwithbacteria bacterium GW2011_GWC2_49_11]OGD4887